LIGYAMSVLLFLIELSYHLYKRYKLKIKINRNWKQTNYKAATVFCFSPVL